MASSASISPTHDFGHKFVVDAKSASRGGVTSRVAKAVGVKASKVKTARQNTETGGRGAVTSGHR